MGGEAAVTDTGIRFRACEYPEDYVFDCNNDPYIFMSLALSAAVIDRPILIRNEQCINKIYANFFNDFKSLGGKFDIIEG